MLRSAAVQDKLSWLPVAPVGNRNTLPLTQCEIRLKAACDFMPSGSQHNTGTLYLPISSPSYILKKLLFQQAAAWPQLIRLHQVETIATDWTGARSPPMTFLGKLSPHWFLPE